MARRTRQTSDGCDSGTIGIKDPFQLVRHLARSQSDPRKAVAELVQNALDEQATAVHITRRRDRGVRMLGILDDGRGVLPDLPREAALRAIAENIGSSRKKQMSFDERMRQAMLGQYGIGLLGFWAVGHELRMLSRVSGSEVWSLTLWEDSPRWEVRREPDDDLTRGATWTEVQVRGLHEAAIGSTVAGRLASYLSVELRGQLIRHNAELTFVDELARGSAEKRLHIVPGKLAGERIEGLGTIAVDGYRYPLDVQLHYVGDEGEDTPRIRLCCAGAVIEDDVGSLGAFAHPPWTDSRLSGMVDFPHLDVPPGSRRGFVPNDASEAMTAVLLALEPRITAALDLRATAEASRLSHDVHKQLARLFSRATGLVPHLDWFGVQRGMERVTDAAPGGSAVAPPPPEDAAADATPQMDLLPAGPLDSVRVRPARLEVAFGETHVLRARALDAEARVTAGGLAFEWSVDGALAIDADGATARVTAGTAAGQAIVTVTASQGRFAGRARHHRYRRRLRAAAPRGRHPAARAGRRAAADVALANGRRTLGGQRRPPRLPRAGHPAPIAPAVPRVAPRQGDRVPQLSAAWRGADAGGDGRVARRAGAKRRVAAGPEGRCELMGRQATSVITTAAEPEPLPARYRPRAVPSCPPQATRRGSCAPRWHSPAPTPHRYPGRAARLERPASASRAALGIESSATRRPLPT
ncbi:MAG: ATP-binding protein [Polyangiaceae bacterium]